MNNVRLSRIERKLDSLTSRVTAGDRRTTRLDRALTHMAVATADGFKGLHAKLDVLARRVVSVDTKLDRLPRLDAKLDSIIETQRHINSELSDKVEDHGKRIDALEKRRA
jgi:chromosome segregation ATPase